MAVLQGCPGIKVSIVSNGQALQEYLDIEGDFNNKDYASPPVSLQSLSYVECASEAEFGIRVELEETYNSWQEHTHLAFRAYVDGQGIGGVNKQIGTWTYDIAEAIIDSSPTEQIRRKLKFSSITKVDDADSVRVKTDAKFATGLGEIIVYVHRCNHELIREPIYGRPTSFITAPKEISEKALKGQAISHGVSFGEEVRVNVPRKTEKAVFIDGYIRPHGVFRFRYRSREGLKQELIIPRSPSPEPGMRPLKPHTQSTVNAALSRGERLAKLKREIDEIKSEGHDGTPGGRKRNRESSGVQSSGRAYKTSRQSNGSVVIDLTADE